MRKTLTALGCDRHHKGTLSDARCSGLRLVATPQKRSWIYRYRLHTRVLHQIKLGEFPRMTLAEAREAWAKQKKIRDNVLDPRLEKKKSIEAEVAKSRAAFSVDEMVSDWIEGHATGLARGNEMERILRREVLPQWKGRNAASIVKRNCVDLFERISKRAPRVAEQMMSAVRGAFALAVKRDRLEMANPAAGVGSMQRAAPKIALTDLELKALIPWLGTAGFSNNVRDAMLLTLLTGCRSGEACAAEWQEVELDTGLWTQPGNKTKNRKTHRVMLSSQATGLLLARADKDTRWVFPSRNNRPLTQKAVGLAQYQLRGECPVKRNWTVHDLRRTALTGLARLGCPRVVQDRIANHVDRSIAATYDLHAYDDEARTWLQKWADHLDGLRVIEKADRVFAPANDEPVARLVA